MICQTVARRTKVTPDEAFLTGLMHGIGRLYIMVRAVEKGEEFGMSAAFRDLIDGWHASIGKAVLETWGFPEELCEAVAVQSETDLRNKGNPICPMSSSRASCWARRCASRRHAWSRPRASIHSKRSAFPRRITPTS